MSPVAAREALRLGIVTRDGRLADWQARCLELLRAEDAAQLVAWRPCTEGARPVAGPLAALPRVRPGEPFAVDVWLLLDGAPDATTLAGSARRGTWTLRHAGALPGALEVLRDEPVTVARLVETHGDGTTVVLRTGALRTVRGALARNRRAIERESARWPAEACRRARAAALTEDATTPAAPEPAPTLAQRLRGVPRGAARRLAQLASRATQVDLWNVGIARVPIGRFLSEPVRVVEWMPAPHTGRLRADPFGLWHGDSGTVVYEALDFAEGRGFLAARSVDAHGFGPEREVLRQPGHLSYPFLVEEAGEVFCAPESFESGEIALWRAAPFPERWEKHAVVRAGYRGIDPTFARHEGRWWCFASNRDDGHATRLDVFWAESLAGPWRAHAANPVLIDARAARGAGTPFVHEGVLYRPAQDYSRAIEHRITIRRVLELTPERFREETAVRLEPLGTGPYPDKLHTLSALGPWTLVDGARTVPAWRARGGLRFKARRLRRCR